MRQINPNMNQITEAQNLFSWYIPYFFLKYFTSHYVWTEIKLL